MNQIRIFQDELIYTSKESCSLAYLKSEFYLFLIILNKILIFIIDQNIVVHF